MAAGSAAMLPCERSSLSHSVSALSAVHCSWLPRNVCHILWLGFWVGRCKLNSQLVLPYSVQVGALYEYAYTDACMKVPMIIFLAIFLTYNFDGSARRVALYHKIGPCPWPLLCYVCPVSRLTVQYKHEKAGTTVARLIWAKRYEGWYDIVGGTLSGK